MAQHFLINPKQFDGAKFAERYNLSPRNPADFSATTLDETTMVLTLREGITIKDDPPIFDPPDDAETARKKETLKALNTEPYLTIYTTLAAVIATEIEKAVPQYNRPSDSDLKKNLEDAVQVSPAKTPATTKGKTTKG